MFYDRYFSICKSAGISPSKAAEEIGLNKASVTNWKKNGYTPRVDVLQRISAYFQVPTDFFTGSPPFDYWELINQDRRAFVRSFLRATGIDSETLDILWGFKFDSLDSTPVKDFIGFLSETVETAQPRNDGDWEIKPRGVYKKEKASDLTEKERRDVAKEVAKIMDSLEESGDLMFDGVPMSDEARASMAAAMRVGLEEARRRNKETYTPKKYRKG